MAIQYINTGSSANAGNGDSIRLAFTKVNNNFAEVTDRINSTTYTVDNGIFQGISVAVTATILDLVVTGTTTLTNVSITGQVTGPVVFDSTGTFANLVVLNTATINHLTAVDLSVANTSTFDDIVVNGQVLGDLNVTNSGSFASLYVANTTTLNDLNINGELHIGTYQGFDDFNIIKDDINGLNFRLRNIHADSFTQINLLDNIDGGLNFVHQNSTGDSGNFSAGQNYIYGVTPTDILNIGKYSDINFFANVDKYYTPSIVSNPSMVIQSVDGTVHIYSSATFHGDVYGIDGVGTINKLANGANEFVLGSDGVLTLPSGNTRIGDVYGAGNDAIVGNTGTAVGIVSQGTSGYVALEWIDNIENIGTTSTQVAAVIINSTFASSSGTVQILTGVSNGPVSSNIWEFGADGTLTAPGHILPSTDLAYDLGSTSSQWRSIHVGTGTIYIGGVALGVNESNYVTVDGNPIITVNTAGNFTVQGDTNIVLGAVVISDTAPPATTPGSQWYNSVDGRTYVAYNGVWVDTSPTIVPAPETYLGEIAIDGNTLNINGSTLTINTSGTLLVNGSEVTGSGGGGDRLTAGTASVILGTDGMVTFPEIDGTKTLWGAVDEDFTIKTTRTDPGSDADINIYAADDIFIEANGDDISLTAANDVSINTDGGTYSWQFGGDGIISLPNGMTINASDSIPTVKIGGTSTWISVDNGGAPPGFYVRTDAGGSDYQWTFDNDGILSLSTASTIMGANEDPNVYIETSTTATTSTWTFGTDGVLTLPADTPIIKGSGTGTDVTIIAQNTATTSTWVFAAGGRTIFPNGTVPEHSYGDVGDKEGMVVFSDPYIYYCKQDYVNTSTDIWVRVAWSGTSW